MRSWNQPSLWRLSVDGGAPTRAVSEELVFPLAWTTTRSGLSFAMRAGPGATAVRFRAFDSGEVTDVLTVEESGHRFLSLAVSPDERTILYGTARPPQFELMLAESFR